MDGHWPFALTFDERRALGKPGACSDAARARRRLDRWKASPAFRGRDRLDRFLRASDLTEEALLGMLGEDATALEARAGEAPPWLEILRRGLAAGSVTEPGQGFLTLLRPLIDCYRKRLRDGARSLAAGRDDVPFDPDRIVTLLLPSLLTRLSLAIQRTLVLETNIARLEESLAGGSPDERFRSFLRSLGEPATRARILGEYPALARQCVTFLEQWHDGGLEFLTRLVADRQALASLVGDTPIGRVTRITGGAGDAHRNGRSVLVLELTGDRKLVYKPRSLAADAAFQKLVRWMNEGGHEPVLGTFRILDRGSYGWTEFIPFAGCGTEDEVARFYRRQGSWLALLYALGATDLHLENLIASGEHPVVIDLETILHPKLAAPVPGVADESAALLLSDSVLTVGLLPAPQHANGRSIDTSGLGATPDQITPFDIDGLEGVGTDQVRIAKVPGKIGEVPSRPLLRGAPLATASYVSCVEEGFVETYRFLMRRREELLAADGPLAGFHDVPVRAVLRPSSFYASLLIESFHPMLLRNALDRELVFCQLWEETARTPALEKVIDSERRQLMAGDIPCFSTRPQSLDLVGGDGTHIPSALAFSGLDGARARIDRLGAADLERQLWLVRAAFATSGEGLGPRRGPAVAYAGFLDAANAIGEMLASTAVRHGGSAAWLSLKYFGDEASAGKGHYRIGIVEPDLYGGLAGIALFLAYLGSVTSEKAYRSLAGEALVTIEARLDGFRARKAPGAFSGLAGIAYVYSHLGVLWERDDLIAKARALAPEIERLIEGDNSLDVIAGAAGCIPVLLAAGETSAAARCAERILHVGWESLRLPRGLAHGTAGIAWALSLVARATGEDRFASESMRAAAFERALLRERWADIPGNETQATWCHGAPGIALARVEMYRTLGSREIREDALAALRATLDSPPLRNHGLCHGALGNLEPLRLAAETFPEDPSWEKELGLRSRTILDDIRRDGFRSSLPAEVAEPGLMMGLSGMGLGLLRLAVRGQVPLLLTLAPPPAQRSSG